MMGSKIDEHQEEYKGYRIMIHQDNVSDSPRDWDNLGTMALFHRRYSLGDRGHGFSHEEVEEILEGKRERDFVWLPVYIYDHSGVALSTSRSYPFNCPWDSGLVGVILVEKSRVRSEFGVKYVTERVRERVLRCLESEVEIYSQFLQGRVYGYNIHDGDGEFVGGCGGYYPGQDGEYEEVLREAKGEVDWRLEQERKRASELQMVLEGINE